jgi:hypothetical protein
MGKIREKKMGKMAVGFNSKLVFTPSGRVLAEWNDNQIEFHDAYLGRIMQQRGIDIPVLKQPDFDGRAVILSSDRSPELFIKAFTELYFHYTYPKNEYRIITRLN